MNASTLHNQIAKRLGGKMALITGGASGIGAATARLFVRHGAKVVIADIQEEAGLALVNDINLSEESISFVHCDVANESDVENAVDTVVAKHGKLDIMFANAGISGKLSIPSILNADSHDIKTVFGVNTFGSFFCAKHAARVMIPAKKGSIIFTASAGVETFGNGPHAYVSSKMATVGLAKNLGIELGQYGVRVNCISPYGVATPLSEKIGISKEKLTEMFKEAANLKGEVLEEEDVANAALYLASNESKYVSGLNLVLDGGYSTTNTALSLAFEKFMS